MSFNKILVTLDGSTLSERALEPALTIANATGGELILLRVVTPMYVVSPFMDMEPVYEDAEQRNLGRAYAYLESVRKRIEDDVPIHAETLLGPVADSIIDYAREEAVDLIVISSHGRSGLSRWVYGSVAEKVLRGAPCATLIVRMAEKGQPETDET